MEKEKKIGEWKQLMVDELTEKIKGNSNFFISDYLGIAADDMNELRRQLESSSSRYMVIKNTIAKIALNNAGLNDLSNLVSGGTGIVFGGDDPLATAKVMYKFGKTNESLKFKGGYVDGAVIDVARINYLASLPGREELIAKIVYGIKSPITGFVSVLGNTIKSLVYVMQAIKDKKGG